MTLHPIPLERSFPLALFLAIILLAAGCGAPPPPPPSFSTTFSIARDGYLHYRLPAGWFDVTADSQAHGNAIWLLRSDYAATMTVNEIRIDTIARREIQHQGLIPLARLTMFLSTKEKGALLQRPPEEFQVQGHRCCSYELLIPSTGDLLRTILLDSGEKIYAVSALGTGGTNKGEDLAAVQMAFLEALRW
jgi:hypothetical protein